MKAIETINLTKSYGKARGIVDVNLIVEEGDIYGFIGPNGAGKSTTIRTILSLIHKDSGEARIFGLDCEKDRVEILKNIGYMPSEVFYYDNMKSIDMLNYSASFYKKDCTKRIKELANILELDLNKKIEDMSLGNKKKVGIIQGLLHSPKLIILDEPTSGLDPLMQKTFFELIKKENDKGVSILFSSHILSEVQKICKNVGIIKDGTIINTQKIEDIRKDTYKKVEIYLNDDISINEINIEGATNLIKENNLVKFIFAGDCNLLISNLNKLKLQNIEITEPSLEEIFLHYYIEQK